MGTVLCTCNKDGLFLPRFDPFVRRHVCFITYSATCWFCLMFVEFNSFSDYIVFLKFRVVLCASCLWLWKNGHVKSLETTIIFRNNIFHVFDITRFYLFIVCIFMLIVWIVRQQSHCIFARLTVKWMPNLSLVLTGGMLLMCYDAFQILSDFRCSPSCTRGFILGSEPVCPPDCFQYKGTLDVFLKVVRQVMRH